MQRKQTMPSTQVGPGDNPAERRASEIRRIQKDIARRRRRNMAALFGQICRTTPLACASIITAVAGLNTGGVSLWECVPFCLQTTACASIITVVAGLNTGGLGIMLVVQCTYDGWPAPYDCFCLLCLSDFLPVCRFRCCCRQHECQPAGAGGPVCAIRQATLVL